MVWPFSKKVNATLAPSRDVALYDTHSHVLWGLDDGARTLEESVAWIEQYAALGYRGVVATPHTNHRLFLSPIDSLVDDLLGTLAVHTAHMAVEVKGGAEVMCVGDYMALMIQRQFRSVGNAFLIEFENQPGRLTRMLEHMLFKMRVAAITLVLAHPERYVDIQQNPELAESLKSKGMLMQINLGSLVGKYGKRAQRLAWQFVANGVADIAATDVHSLADFEIISGALDELERYDKDCFERLVSVNPRLLFEGKVEKIADAPE